MTLPQTGTRKKSRRSASGWVEVVFMARTSGLFRIECFDQLR